MDERLAKRWAVTESLLKAAAVEIAGAPEYQESCDFLSHNELELALDVLEHAGQSLVFRGSTGGV
jgi:phosphopantetheinyl transferase (holo-ACP synthase)